MVFRIAASSVGRKQKEFMAPETLDFRRPGIFDPDMFLSLAVIQTIRGTLVYTSLGWEAKTEISA
jgi:hypothetical protein